MKTNLADRRCIGDSVVIENDDLPQRREFYYQKSISDDHLQCQVMVRFLEIKLQNVAKHGCFILKVFIAANCLSVG